MRWFKWHPDERLLNRFADGELGEREHARIAGHLAGCPPCREEVGLVRRIGDVARTLPGPIATDEVLRRALARRGAGERVLLPMSDAGATRPVPVRRFAPAAAAAVLTLLMVGLVFSVRVLEADRPALRIHPESPAAGEALRVEYHGGALFADQTHLALRARYRTADDHHWQLLAGVLARGEDGLYRTEVQLPDSVVYAAFAVEDLHGERLDSNNRELWDVMVHGEDGNPTLDAMTARLRDLELRDWGAAYEVAGEMTELYPDEPQSWSIRFSYELGLFDRDSVFAIHQEQFTRLERVLSQTPDADPLAMAWLTIYAVDLGNFDSAKLWISRARSQAPQLPVVAGAESLLLLMENVADPAAILPDLESVWARLDGRSRTVAHAGWQAALASESPAAILRWSERYLLERPAEDLTLLPEAYVAPTLRPQLVARVQDFLARPERWHEAERPLRLPIEAHIRFESKRLQGALSQSAMGAAALGDVTHARALARLGSDLAWDSEALLTIARVLMEAGEPDEAIAVLARAAADPATARTISSLAWAPVDEEWYHRVEQARGSLRDFVMEDAIIRYLPEEPQLLAQDGRVSFSQVHAGRTTVVVFLSRYCEPALNEAALLPALASQLEELGAQLLAVSIDNTSAIEAYLPSVGYRAPVYRDHRGEIRSAFRSSATAQFFVVDTAGRVRFEYSAPSEVLRQVWALQNPSAPMPAAVTD